MAQMPPSTGVDTTKTALHFYHFGGASTSIPSVNFPEIPNNNVALKNSNYSERNSLSPHSHSNLSHVPLSIDVSSVHCDAYHNSPPSASSETMILTPPVHWQGGFQRRKESVDDFFPECYDYSRDFSSVCQAPQARRDSSQTFLPTSQRLSSAEGCANLSDAEVYWDNFERPHKESDGFPAFHFNDHDRCSMEQNISSSHYSHIHPSHSFDTQFKGGAKPVDPVYSLPHSTAGSPLPFPSVSLSIPVIQPPIKLHQPRPSRRIPIISLSELASECSDTVPTTGQPPRFSEPVAALSPLPLDLESCSPALLSARWGEGLPPSNAEIREDDPYSPYLAPVCWGEVISCSCGCLESYNFH